MNDKNQLREMLISMRVNAGLSQSQLAERLRFTPSRLSRLESGDTELSKEDAEAIAAQIGSDEARSFVLYLNREWRVLDRPKFNHVSMAALCKAEEALQRVAQLEADPNLKNVFVKQIHSCREALERAAHALISTEHPIAFIGAVGVGKTTVICTLAELRDRERDVDPDKQMAMQTGGGRQTLSEVHVKNGGEFSILVEPYTAEEIYQYVSEFCDDLLSELSPERESLREGPGLSAEAERALRNMTGLIVKRPKGADGRTIMHDTALDLARVFPKREDLIVQILLKMDLPRRYRTSIQYPRGSSMTGLEWVSKTFGEINYGRHAEFSFPRRIEITVPKRILETEEFELRLIDTRGVDEPTAPRRDLQAYLDDPRAAIVLCSGFRDAPAAAVQSVIERAVEGGLRDELLNRGMLLVLPNGDEDRTLRDPASGERVANVQEGREIRRDQIAPTLHPYGFKALAVHFADVRSADDFVGLRSAIVDKVREIRCRQEREVDFLAATIDRLIANRKTEETRAVFNAAAKDLRKWFGSCEGLPRADMDVQSALIENIDGLRYASSLRASVNRRGNWHNFDYWHGLGFGTRREVVARAAKQVAELRVLAEAVLRDEELVPAHDFVQHFARELDREVNEYYQWAQALGEGAFQSELGEDVDYWRRCQGRWGGGPGYKSDISRWTSSWFDESTSKERTDFIETELQRRWKAVFIKLDGLLEAAESQNGGVDLEAKAGDGAAIQNVRDMLNAEIRLYRGCKYSDLLKLVDEGPEEAERRGLNGGSDYLVLAKAEATGHGSGIRLIVSICDAASRRILATESFVMRVDGSLLAG